MHTMKRLALSCRSVAVIFLWVAKAAMGMEASAPPFDIDRWLNGPDRRDFKWQILISPPFRMLEQRYFVNVSVKVGDHSSKETASRHDIHFVLKIAIADNRWTPGYIYKHVPLRRSSGLFETGGGVYLRPGTYTLGIIVYDAATKQGNVLRRVVKIPRSKPEPLPELDSDLRDIEFPPPLDRRVRLPVNNDSPLCVDIVANISGNADVLELSAFLAELAPRNGNVRVSILDILRMQQFADREDARHFNWNRARVLIGESPRVTIAASLLASFTPASFFVDRIETVLKQKDCVPGTESPARTVILVSDELQLYRGTALQQVAPPDMDSTRFFYFCLGRGYRDDDLPRMMKKTNLQKKSANWFLNPTSFRKSVASLISTLECLK